MEGTSLMSCTNLELVFRNLLVGETFYEPVDQAAVGVGVVVEKLAHQQLSLLPHLYRYIIDKL